MKKRIAFFLILFSVFVQANNIRVLIESSNVIKANIERGVIEYDGKKENISGELIISSSSAGITVFDGSKKIVTRSCFINTSNLKIGNRNYSGKFHTYKSTNKINLVLHLDIEEYVCGVIPGEMPIDWPDETLKAQAVLIRTFAHYHKMQNKRNYDVGSDYNYQIFTHNKHINDRVRKISRETAGIVAVYEDFPIIIFYHSTCGGMTETSEDIWGTGFPYIVSRECGFCTDSPQYQWEFSLDLDELLKYLSEFDKDFPYITSITAAKNRSGRLKSIVFENVNFDKRIEMPAKDFRMRIGPNRLKSISINSIEIGSDYVLFKGKGFGHGVGMCQFGARRMGEMGYNYQDIILHYFRDVSFKNLNTK